MRRTSGRHATLQYTPQSILLANLAVEAAAFPTGCACGWRIFDRSRIHGPRQLTDVYLLGLAAHHGGRLVTFDRTIALAAVRTARRANLVVL